MMQTPYPQGVLDRLEAARLLAVITLDDPADALPLADALAAGGVTALELALRTASSPRALEALAARTELLIGAGTVLDTAQAEHAATHGARFIVSPGYDDDVVAAALRLGLTPIPGVATPSEVQRAVRAGLSVLKLFPAGVLGGPAMLDALRGPFPHLRFLPSGGVGQQNAAAYLAHPGVLAISGSWMVPSALIAARDWPGITRLASAAIAALDHPDGSA